MLLFLNGIHQYVPYDGYVGLGRFTTFYLAETRIVKGTASLLFPHTRQASATNCLPSFFEFSPLFQRDPADEFESAMWLA